MAFLSQQAIIWSIFASAVALYIKYTGVSLLKNPQLIESQLSPGPQAHDTFVQYLGRVLFAVASLAWVALSAQAAVSAVRRYRYRQRDLPPLRPITAEAAQQQRQQLQRQAGLAASTPSNNAGTAAAAVGPSINASNNSLQQQPHQIAYGQQQRLSALDEGRRRASEAAQRKLDEQAALLKAKQQQVEAQLAAKRARAATDAAAAAVAAQAAAEASRAAATEAEARRWQLWHQAQQQQRSVSGGGSSGGISAAGTSAATTATATAGQLQADRQLRDQQDKEYAQSLAADQQKQKPQQQPPASQAALQAQHMQEQQQEDANGTSEQQQQQRHQSMAQQQLQQLRSWLQEQLELEPAHPSCIQGDSNKAAQSAATGSGNDASTATTVLNIRVRLPDGSTAMRRFSTLQQFSKVQDWVFTLPRMPLWEPGKWRLASSFPKCQLQVSDGIWAPGEYQGATGDKAGALPQWWQLSVRRVEGEILKVLVHNGNIIKDVKKKVHAATGLSPERQRLVFSGKVLNDNATLQQLGINASHKLLLAPRIATPGEHSQGAQGTVAAAAEGAIAGSAGSSSCGASEGVLVVHDVAQLLREVAQGDAQLALYVLRIAE
eukprot:GHRR01007115.1.p1 GENE.GHRR01007115.1~~GHRR01007115.1.p1  ORF type:complete len:605 (+),score=270.56 GHRR01007115.1:161-1975(+)